MWPFKRKPGPWTPGRIVDEFRGWEPAPGAVVSVAYAVQAGGISVIAGTTPTLAATALRHMCVCPNCLAGTEWPETIAEIKAELAEHFRSGDVVFRASKPADASVN